MLLVSTLARMFLVTLLGSAAPSGVTAEPAHTLARLPLVEVVARMQARYDGTASYQARFEQAQLNVAFGRTRRASGEVFFKKPGRMRWNYDAPDRKIFVSNAEVLWLYEPADKQAFKQDLKGSQLPAALAFLMGKGKLADDFEITFAGELPYGRPEDYRLSLKPRAPQSQYKSIYFIVDPVTYQVRQSVLIDTQGNVNDITFNDVKLNPRLPDSLFDWKPPRDVRVIESAGTGPPFAGSK